MDIINTADIRAPIHWNAGDIKPGNFLLNFNSHTMMAVRITFFQNVDQFEIIRKSPKHPQSLTGLLMAIQNVKGNMKHIIMSAAIGDEFL